jgi:hypothetical protein
MSAQPADDRDAIAREMLGDGPRRCVDPHSVIAADLLRDRLRRKEGMARACEAYRAGKVPAGLRREVEE